ncbi:MAG: hypothetical protein WAZ77_12015 [Candidatus Nitrosopolaris sp.]
MHITVIVACAGYSFYGIQWSTKDGRYLWDGSLLSNTPMLEAINASPEYNKRFFDLRSLTYHGILTS